ncbi:phage tail family protein [Clostridium tyrobutyricum]|uniref:distal tail protein Dit n=1 Tax=Clostridium tyrobutyricum TaxID=1519 RepID=UPI001C38971B|nr:distal tail protein Dit [Clostridium tyrobutyricum]MBV4447741.1 phage tail family protein [Clostridium tyrobutyricum]
MYGITFNGKHSLKDIGLYAEDKTINAPGKKKITDSVPFMHGFYDFSTVGSNGEQVYDTRTITVTLRIIAYSMEELHTVYSQALEWLMDAGKQKLQFDFMPDFYFMAEVQDAPDWDKFLKYGLLTVDFVCDPFKYSTSYMGDDIWDTFNFLTDYTQYTNEFEIDGETKVVMYNNGKMITPIINCSTAMSLNYGGKTYNLNAGDNKLWGLKLKNGKNELIFSGNGTVKILFRWESL